MILRKTNKKTKKKEEFELILVFQPKRDQRLEVRKEEKIGKQKEGK